MEDGASIAAGYLQLVGGAAVHVSYTHLIFDARSSSVC